MLISFWFFPVSVKGFTKLFNDVTHLEAVRKYSPKSWLFGMPFIPPNALTALFSCSIAWSIPIAENGIDVLLTEKLPW